MLHLLTSIVLGLSSGSDPLALERALGSVRSENIRADIFFIASDELAGRDTPSPGQRLAARYIRARLERLGFTPGGDDGFFDRYQMERSGLDVGACKLWLRRSGSEEQLAFGTDYAFWGARDLELEGPLVYVGSGSADDLQGVDLKGRWALALDAEGGRSRAAWQERQARVERVKAAGALGLVSAPDPRAADAGQRDQFLARMAGFAREPGLRPVAEHEEPASEALPTLTLSSTRAAALLGDVAKVKPGAELGASLGERCKMAAREVIDLENVAGLWPGSDPVLGKEVLIVSAHYDHVGVQDGQIYNGADDNGSGTTGMLALAEALAQYGPMRRSVLLLWVSGEEKGLLGSQAWTTKPTLPAGDRPVSDLNIDMIGRNAPDKLLITPTRELEKEYNGLTRLAEALSPLEGFPVLGSCDEYWNRSDQANFAENLKIPVAFLFSDVHEDYHQPGDDPEKIDCDKIRRVTRLVLRMLDGLQGDELKL